MKDRAAYKPRRREARGGGELQPNRAKRLECVRSAALFVTPARSEACGALLRKNSGAERAHSKRFAPSEPNRNAVLCLTSRPVASNQFSTLND
jgi:hypothetical protein